MTGKKKAPRHALRSADKGRRERPSGQRGRDPAGCRHGDVEERKRHGALLTAIYCLLAIGIAYALTGVIFGVAIVRGDSMTPTLRDGDLVIYCRISAEYERGDIVLIKTENAREDYIKRVCALPHETAEYGADGGFRVNGAELSEPYIYEKTYAKDGGAHSVALEEKQYFVMGDHRTNSRDSRDYGGVNAEAIAGKALLIFRLCG